MGNLEQQQKWLTSLRMYRPVNDLQDLRLGRYTRWFRKQPNGQYKLTNGGFLLQVLFKDNGCYIVCKKDLHMMQYMLDECMTLQKLTAEEWVLLMANEYEFTTN